MSSLPLNPSKSFIARNPQLYGNPNNYPFDSPLPASEMKKRIRQSSKPLMNKLETEFHAKLANYAIPHTALKIQAVRFKLGNGIWYKPDFFLFIPRATAWEVKGPHNFRGGFENLKVAASQYPDIVWILTWKEDGRWLEQQVLP